MNRITLFAARIVSHRHILGTIFACCVVVIGLSSAGLADTLFYNGDPSGPDATQNQRTFGTANVYQYTEFTVPAATQWQVTGVFANTVYNLDNNFPLNSPSNTQAFFEIRSGVSNGNGGTLLDSGTVSALPVPMGFSNAGYDGFRIEADFSPIQLSAGTYWMSIVPVGNNDNLAFVWDTPGTNGVNVVPGQQTYFTQLAGATFSPGGAKRLG